MRFPRAALLALPLVTAGLLVASASAAVAQDTPNGQNGSTAPISTVAIVLLFVGGPLLIMVLGALVTVPRRNVGALRYRPGRGWGYDREWFGQVPPGAGGDAAAAQSRITPAQSEGANTGPAHPATAAASTGAPTVGALAAITGAPVLQPGGASADW